MENAKKCIEEAFDSLNIRRKSRKIILKEEQERAVKELIWRMMFKIGLTSASLPDFFALVPQDSNITLLRASLLTVCVLFMPLFVLVSCFMLYTSFSDWLL